MSDDIVNLFGKPGFAMPMMRGFSCPVSPPIMGGRDAPRNGLGFGWSNVAGHGLMFFLSVHGEDGMVLTAQLDYARYVRLCQNMAAAGKQAQLVEKVDEAKHDPLAALAKAHEALEGARDTFQFYADENARKAHKLKDPDEKSKARKRAAVERAKAGQMDEALSVVGKALGLIEPWEKRDGT